MLLAIRFVLSESLTNLRAEERQQLLFERAGQPAFEAQVAIHFDNSDERIPVCVYFIDHSLGDP